jgi:hypothetical protein
MINVGVRVGASFLMLACLCSCASAPNPELGPSASVSSGRLDDRARELCQSIPDVGAGLDLASALDSNASDVLEIAAEKYRESLKAQIAGHESDYVAACYFLASPPATDVLILGILEPDTVITVDSFE